MKITVKTIVNSDLNTVWDAWKNPQDIKQWNAAQDDWHTTHSTVDLREGGGGEGLSHRVGPLKRDSFAGRQSSTIHDLTASPRQF